MRKLFAMDISPLEQALGFERITSIDDFKSNKARILAAVYAIPFGQIPELRYLVGKDDELALARRIAIGEIRAQTVAQGLVANAMFYFELAERKKPFRLVGDELTGAIAQLWGAPKETNMNAAQVYNNLAVMYSLAAAKIYQPSNKDVPAKIQ